jgi:hypothetical protein
MARSTAAHPKVRRFSPTQARHGLVTTVPGLARPVFRARAWAATPAGQAASHDTLIPTSIYKHPQIFIP